MTAIAAGEDRRISRAAKASSTHPTKLRIGGMTCAACVARVERALTRATPGSALSVNLASSMAYVAAGDRAFDALALIAAVEAAGYDTAVEAELDARDPLAASGVLSPILGGATMAFLSVSVVANSLRLRRWRPAVSAQATREVRA
jgi:cation transport ATPase